MNMSGKIYLPENSLFVRKKNLFAPLTNLAALALLVAVLCLTVTKNATVNLIWTCSVFALMAASLNITMGFMGQLALGHMGFMAVGAYLGTLVANCFKGSGVFSSASDAGYLPVFFLCILAGGVGAALIGFLVGMPALRLKGDYLAIITLGFGLIVTNVLNNIAGSVLYREKCGLYITGKLQVKFLPLIVLIAAGCLALMYNFIHSRYGRALKSIRDDSIAASASGLNISFYKVFGFTFSAFFAGVSGVLYAASVSSLTTSSFAFSNSSIYNSIFIVVMVVLGGMGSLTGSVVAGVGMVALNNAITKIPAGVPVLGALAKYPMLLYALVLIVFILFRPRGIFGTREVSLYRALCNLPHFAKTMPARIRALKKQKSPETEGKTDE